MRETVQAIMDGVATWGPWLLAAGMLVPAVALVRLWRERRRHGRAASLEWLRIGEYRPFTIVIDRRGMLRRHVFGASDYAGFESLVRPHL